jgi:hypothetical protein
LQEDEIVKAASATYTVLVRNPEDKMMVKNFEYYLTLLGTVPEVDVEEPVSKTQTHFRSAFQQRNSFQRFARFYHRGIELYEKEDYETAIEQLEMSLNEYIHEENKCRTFCEGEFDQGWHPDMYSAVSSKRSCRLLYRLVEPNQCASFQTTLSTRFTVSGTVPKTLG